MSREEAVELGQPTVAKYVGESMGHQGDVVEDDLVSLSRRRVRVRRYCHRSCSFQVGECGRIEQEQEVMHRGLGLKWMGSR